MAEAMTEIKAELLYEKENDFYQSWLKELRDHFPVKTDQDALKTLKLG